MPVPSTAADLSTTAASNSPAGSDAIGTSLDDYLRSIQAIIKQQDSKGADIASSTTIDIPSSGKYFVVTGTTTIAGISDDWNGRTVVLKFSGALQLTHSASFILPGSANITTAAGDCLMAVNESTGVWRVVSYQRVNGTPVLSAFVSVKDFGATGDGSTDDTSSIQTAINTVGPNGALYFPPGTYKVTSVITISENRVNLLGAGPWSTQILFAPTADGSCFKFSAGAAILYQCSLKNMSFYSTDSTYKKRAIEFIDTSGCVLEDIVIGGAVEALPGTSFWADTSDESVGLWVKGRDLGRVSRFTSFANRPIQISGNPNDTIDIDHFHFEDTYLGAADNPCVLIDDGVNLTNVTFDGANAWVHGTHGLYWNDTTTVGVSSGLVINNVRTEQGQNTANYGIYVAHNASLQGVAVRGFTGGGNADRNSFYFRKCDNVTLDNCNHQGSARTALNVDSTVKRISIINCFWQAGASATITGQKLVYASPKNPSTGPLAPNAIYNESASATRDVTIGGAISDELITLADDAQYSIGPTGTAGLLFIADSEGLGAIYLLRGTANTVNEVSDPVTVFQPTDTDGYNCIFWDAGSSAYVLKNRRGAQRRYKISLLGSYSTF